MPDIRISNTAFSRQEWLCEQARVTGYTLPVLSLETGKREGAAEIKRRTNKARSISMELLTVTHI
jgi:hypothetical protein